MKQIASGFFVMIGPGHNVKSMAYVENVAAFLQYTMTFPVGVHVYNYIDKPDFSMNGLICLVRKSLGKSERIRFRLPCSLGYGLAKAFDVVANVTGKRFPISSIRVKSFVRIRSSAHQYRKQVLFHQLPFKRGSHGRFGMSFLKAIPTSHCSFPSAPFYLLFGFPKRFWKSSNQNNSYRFGPN